VLTFIAYFRLYLASAIAEENSRQMRKLLLNYIATVVILQLILWLDGIPLKYVVASIGCHLVFYSLLRDFPYVEIMSLSAISSCVAVVLQHYIWFDYFAKVATDGRHHNLTLTNLVGFFVVFVWALPAGFFISLTFADETLPGTIGVGSRVGSPEFNGAFVHQKKKTSVFKRAADVFLSKKDDLVYNVAPGVSKQY
jgi:hypothetical protein